MFTDIFPIVLFIFIISDRFFNLLVTLQNSMNEITVTLKVVAVGQHHSGNVTTDLVVVNLTPIVGHFGCRLSRV